MESQPLGGDRHDVVPTRQEDIDAGRVEVEAAAVFEVLPRHRQRHRLFIWTGGCERVEHVGDRDDPRRDRNFLALQFVRVAFAIPALVMTDRDVGGELNQFAPAAGQNRCADRGVSLHHGDLVRGQLARLEQNMVGGRDLADVVQRCSQIDVAAQPFRQSQPFRDHPAVLCNPEGVIACVVVAIFDRQRQPKNDLFLALLQRVGGARHLARQQRRAVVQLTDCRAEPDHVAQADLGLEAFRPLRQEVGRAGRERLQPHFVAFDRGDHHDRDVGEFWQRAQPPDQTDAVHLRHLVVGKDDVDVEVAGRCQGQHRVGESRHLNLAVGFDRSLQVVQRGPTVVHNQCLNKHIAQLTMCTPNST